MAQVTHKLSNSLEGALAGGGDPATSPLYVFGPFLKLIVVAGVAQITFGASVWLVILTIALVSMMYRLVMIWITDGSGGSGLCEEEFGSWAVKLNASITFVEYTLTFLVSMAALITFIADRFPRLNNTILFFEYRTILAIGLSIATGWLVNRGPKVAAHTFGPATAGVLILLWSMVIATIFNLGLNLPEFKLQAFNQEYLPYTLGGYVRILAVMTGIEIFANLVAAYEGEPRKRSRMAFVSLLIIMGTTAITMLVVGPAILELSTPANSEVSVFTQTMDQLLPRPLALLGTIVGVLVLLSASAASAQGLQNLALGLKTRHYIPAIIGQRNAHEVAALPVWIEVGVVSICFLVFGTNEETYLAVYAAGVFILLSMTGWAATKRLLRQAGQKSSFRSLSGLIGTATAAFLTTVATLIIFVERFLEGAWTYFVFLPLLYFLFTYFRNILGPTLPAEERVGLKHADTSYLSAGNPDSSQTEVHFQRIVVPLDGSGFAEHALPAAKAISKVSCSQLTLLSVAKSKGHPLGLPIFSNGLDGDLRQHEKYLNQVVQQLRLSGISASYLIRKGEVVAEINALATDTETDLLVMSTHGRSGLSRLLVGSVAAAVVHSTSQPILLVRPSAGKQHSTLEFSRLLVALDGSTESELIIPYALTLATFYQSEVILMLAIDGLPDPAEHDRLNIYLDDIASKFSKVSLPAQYFVTGNEPAYTIVQMANKFTVDMIMLVAQGQNSRDRALFGSRIDTVMHNGHIPIFLVPAF